MSLIILISFILKETVFTHSDILALQLLIWIFYSTLNVA